MVICVIAAEWGEGGVEAQGRAVLEAGAIPRIAVEAGRLWADSRGVRLGHAVAELRHVLRQAGARGVRCGVARTPIAAWAAASTANAASTAGTGPPADAGSAGDTGSAAGAGSVADAESAGVAESAADDGATRVVEAGTDRAFLATLGLEYLEPEDRLRALLEGVGIVTCGQLAEVSREAVEVRFGGGAVPVWRLARADDRRVLFGPIPPERSHASLDFVDYVVTDADQLVFTANALIGNLCGQLSERGEHARALRLDLPLANGERWSRVLQPARPTSSRAVWLRLARSVLERLTVPDAVTGVELRVQATDAASTIQGDLFDSGFATAGAVDAALTRLLETQGPVLVRPEPIAHPLPERGIQFRPAALTPATDEVLSDAPPDIGLPSLPPPAGGRSSTATAAAAGGLTLQLLPRARPVHVETARRRDHQLPVRYRDGRWIDLATAAGPERISGGTGKEFFAREYFHGVTTEGILVLLFRDARADAWYLQGWWD